MHFQSKPYIYNINLAPTCFGAAGAPTSGSPKYPDEIVRMLRHKCQISDVPYAQFRQDTLGSLKMTLMQRLNM
jgi:hypothetical protein